MWRPASPADEPRVLELCLALYAEDPGTVAADAGRTRETLARFREEPRRGRCVVLEEEGRVEGYALLVPYWSNELGGDVCHLDEVYVSPAARGRGRAGELIALLAERAFGGEDAVALQLEVSPSNARARALYERSGFAPVRNANLRRLLPRSRTGGPPRAAGGGHLDAPPGADADGSVPPTPADPRATVLSHLSLGARSLATSTPFFDACLAPLGLVRLYGTDRVSGYGLPGGDAALDVFHVAPEEPREACPGFHVAFEAPDRAAVDAFHAAALGAGGADAGPPGLRPRYGAGYYAAYVLDPDGHRIEAVHHVA